MISPASFRADFPAFSTAQATDQAIIFWADIGEMLLDARVWGAGSTTAVSPPSTIRDYGLELFVAYQLAVEQQNAQAAANGGPPVGPAGPVSSRSVGPVSKGMDVNAAIDAGDGAWNLNNYGTRFIQLAKLRGNVPLHVMAPSCPVAAGAWQGPVPWLIGPSW